MTEIYQALIGRDNAAGIEGNKRIIKDAQIQITAEELAQKMELRYDWDFDSSHYTYLQVYAERPEMQEFINKLQVMVGHLHFPYEFGAQGTENINDWVEPTKT